MHSVSAKCVLGLGKNGKWSVEWCMPFSGLCLCVFKGIKENKREGGLCSLVVNCEDMRLEAVIGRKLV